MEKTQVAKKTLRHFTKAASPIFGLLFSLSTHAAGIPTLDTVVVEANADELLGTANSATVGTVTREQILARPVFRPAEVLEEVPGLIITQHSSEGKANQYFLRGFNLDHGTDFRIDFNGTPVNQRSHGHGQGWADLNFLLPELVNDVQYKKGPYFADEGDFSSAGAVDIDYVDVLPQGIASLTIGEFDYRRLFAANSNAVGTGNLLYGLELFGYDGPWNQPDDFKKINGVLRYSFGTPQNGFGLTAMAYDASGTATNQVAQRAIDQGVIDRFGTLDPTDGIDVGRYSLNAQWQRTDDTSVAKANAYALRHELDLFSNFTYFLDNPARGDHFLQKDDRVTTGVNGSYTSFADWGGHAVENVVGVQFQNDNIFNGLFRTDDREILSTTRQDHIVESSVGAYFENRTQWLEKFRTVAGVRADYFRFDVDSDRAENSGRVNDNIINPKLGLIFGPWAKTEYFVNLGGGFHSNDARGTTITTDPGANIGENIPSEKVPGLVRAKGYELGARTAIIPGLQSSLALYVLDFDSELVFIGDAGNTEAGRASQRVGFEFANFYKPTDWLTIDADIAFAKARFTEDDPGNPGLGDRVPGAVEGVVTLGATIDNIGPWFGGVQFRYFGPRPLTEDNSVRSEATLLVSGRVGYKIKKGLRVQLEGFNLLNRNDSQIDYSYESRLAQERSDPSTVSGVSDIHFKPVEPRSFRLTASLEF